MRNASRFPVNSAPLWAGAGNNLEDGTHLTNMKVQEYLSQSRISRHPVIIDYIKRNAIPDNDGEPYIPAPLATIAQVSAGIIKRLSLPATKAKGKDGIVKQAGSPRILNVSDCEDVIGIVTSTLAERDAFSRDLSRDDWNACFQFARAKSTGLNLNNDKSFDISDYVARVDNSRLDGRRNFNSPRNARAIERRFQYLRDCLKLSFEADTSRKRVSKYADYYAMLDLSRSYMIGRDTGFHAIAPGLVRDLEDLYACEMLGSPKGKVREKGSARRVFVHRFREYLAIGESILEENSKTLQEFA